MKSSSGKTFLFFAGLLSGALVGGLITYALIGGEEPASPISQAYQLEPQIDEKVTTTSSSLVSETSYQNGQDDEKEGSSDIEDTKVEDELTDDLEKSDSTILADLPSDSVEIVEYEVNPVDTLDLLVKMTEDSIAPDAIVVREDELIWTQAHNIIYVGDTINDDPSRIDSLIAETSGVRIDDEVEKLDLEFWQSPINYQGYKLGKKKLLLYGINRPDSVWLYGWDEKLYLKTVGQVYELDYTDDFKSFNKVLDQRVLNALNQ